MYKAVFALGYYGLMHIGELTLSPHAVKAKDIHLAGNKDKILIVLYSSKTHGRDSPPQKIKITAAHTPECLLKKHKLPFFCPFTLAHNYMELRGGFADDQEQFFVPN